MPANSQRMGKVRNNEVWLCGRVFTSATTMGGDPNKTERSYDRFGLDTNIQDTNTVDGNFTLKGVTAEAGIEVQRCGVGYDPDVEVAISVGNDDSKAMPLWTNLREPKRDAGEQQIYDMAVSMEVDLTPAALLAAATRRTGREDLGDLAAPCHPTDRGLPCHLSGQERLPLRQGPAGLADLSHPVSR